MKLPEAQIWPGLPTVWNFCGLSVSLKIKPKLLPKSYRITQLGPMDLPSPTPLILVHQALWTYLVFSLPCAFSHAGIPFFHFICWPPTDSSRLSLYVTYSRRPSPSPLHSHTWLGEVTILSVHNFLGFPDHRTHHLELASQLGCDL